MDDPFLKLDVLLNFYTDSDGGLDEVPLEVLYNEMNSKIPDLSPKFDVWERILPRIKPRLVNVVKLLERGDFREEKFPGENFANIASGLDSVSMLKECMIEDEEYCLDTASLYGCLNVIKYLRGRYKLQSYSSAMENAAMKGHYEVVKYLIDLGTYASDLALRLACHSGCLKIVKLLVEKGCNPKSDSNYCLRWASTKGHLEVVKYLAEMGCSRRNDDPIIFASYNGHLEVVQYLFSIGYNPMAENDYAIRSSSCHGQLGVIKYLVSIGCDPRAENDYAIKSASFKGHLEVVKYLASLGCDPRSENYWGIRRACINGHLEVVRYLIEECDCDPLFDNNLLLILASEHGHLEVVKYLIKSGCDPKAENNLSIRSANDYGHLEVVEYLRNI